MSHHSNFIVDGIRYPSVTEILGAQPKPWLDMWKAKWGILADRKVQAACNIGDDFDSAVTHRVNGVEYEATYRRTWKMLLKFIKVFEIPYYFVPEVVQIHVVSNAYKFHGTFDAIGRINGKDELCLFDWKTSSSIYPDYALQLAAYAIAYEEQTGIKIKRGFIVHVSKDKPHHDVTVKEYKLGKLLRNKFLKRLSDYRERG